MATRLLMLGQLQRKILAVVSIVVVVPMLVAGWFAAEWVSKSFEERLQQWIVDAARANQNWLQAYQNDAAMLGRVLADDRKFVASIARSPANSMPAPVPRIAQELGVGLLQVYTVDQRLVFSSLPIQMEHLWEVGQTEAVLKVVGKQKSLLAAISITPVPRRGITRYFLVIGSLLGEDFTRQLSQLTGLKTRLYYRDGRNYFDVFSDPDGLNSLRHLSDQVLWRLEQEKQPFYSVEAERGLYRGLYMPMVDSTGRVEAIMFSGLERRGYYEVLTSRITLFGCIAVLGLLIGGLTGLLLSRMVIRPLEDLRNGVMQLAGQNFHANVPIRSDDELGDLAKAFNAMAARLRESRDAQVQRFRKDKLAALGEVSAALAHEIRNPLGVISASAALLEQAAKDNPVKRGELTRMIREESTRVSTLVQEFLQLSRHRQPVFAPIDPAEPMERALTLALAGGDHVRVVRAYNHNGAHIHADAGLLQQAWTNLYTNAIEAGNGATDLWLTTSVRDGYVRLQVEDSGPGVPAEIMPRLFEPFFTTKQQGTGLGLTIAYTLTDANGGRLEALAPLKRGARFVMEFPIYVARSEPTPPPLQGEGKGWGWVSGQVSHDLKPTQREKPKT